jgi:hypothetical protein
MYSMILILIVIVRIEDWKVRNMHNAHANANGNGNGVILIRTSTRTTFISIDLGVYVYMEESAPNLASIHSGLSSTISRDWPRPLLYSTRNRYTEQPCFYHISTLRGVYQRHHSWPVHVLDHWRVDHLSRMISRRSSGLLPLRYQSLVHSRDRTVPLLDTKREGWYKRNELGHTSWST